MLNESGAEVTLPSRAVSNRPGSETDKQPAISVHFGRTPPTMSPDSVRKTVGSRFSNSQQQARRTETLQTPDGPAGLTTSIPHTTAHLEVGEADAAENCEPVEPTAQQGTLRLETQPQLQVQSTQLVEFHDDGNANDAADELHRTVACPPTQILELDATLPLQTQKQATPTNLIVEDTNMNEFKVTPGSSKNDHPQVTGAGDNSSSQQTGVAAAQQTVLQVIEQVCAAVPTVLDATQQNMKDVAREVASPQEVVPAASIGLFNEVSLAEGILPMPSAERCEHELEALRAEWLAESPPSLPAHGTARATQRTITSGLPSCAEVLSMHGTDAEFQQAVMKWYQSFTDAARCHEAALRINTVIELTAQVAEALFGQESEKMPPTKRELWMQILGRALWKADADEPVDSNGEPNTQIRWIPAKDDLLQGLTYTVYEENGHHDSLVIESETAQHEAGIRDTRTQSDALDAAEYLATKQEVERRAAVLAELENLEPEEAENRGLNAECGQPEGDEFTDEELKRNLSPFFGKTVVAVPRSVELENSAGGIAQMPAPDGPSALEVELTVRQTDVLQGGAFQPSKKQCDETEPELASRKPLVLLDSQPPNETQPPVAATQLLDPPQKLSVPGLDSNWKVGGWGGSQSPSKVENGREKIQNSHGEIGVPISQVTPSALGRQGAASVPEQLAGSVVPDSQPDGAVLEDIRDHSGAKEKLAKQSTSSQQQQRQEEQEQQQQHETEAGSNPAGGEAHATEGSDSRIAPAGGPNVSLHVQPLVTESQSQQSQPAGSQEVQRAMGAIAVLSEDLFVASQQGADIEITNTKRLRGPSPALMKAVGRNAVQRKGPTASRFARKSDDAMAVGNAGPLPAPAAQVVADSEATESLISSPSKRRRVVSVRLREYEDVPQPHDADSVAAEEIAALQAGPSSILERQRTERKHPNPLQEQQADQQAPIEAETRPPGGRATKNRQLRQRVGARFMQAGRPDLRGDKLVLVGSAAADGGGGGGGGGTKGATTAGKIGSLRGAAAAASDGSALPLLSGLHDTAECYVASDTAATKPQEPATRPNPTSPKRDPRSLAKVHEKAQHFTKPLTLKPVRKSKAHVAVQAPAEAAQADVPGRNNGRQDVDDLDDPYRLPNTDSQQAMPPPPPRIASPRYCAANKKAAVVDTTRTVATRAAVADVSNIASLPVQRSDDPPPVPQRRSPRRQQQQAQPGTAEVVGDESGGSPDVVNWGIRSARRRTSLQQERAGLLINALPFPAIQTAPTASPMASPAKPAATKGTKRPADDANAAPLERPAKISKHRRQMTPTNGGKVAQAQGATAKARVGHESDVDSEDQTMAQYIASVRKGTKNITSVTARLSTCKCKGKGCTKCRRQVRAALELEDNANAVTSEPRNKGKTGVQSSKHVAAPADAPKAVAPAQGRRRVSRADPAVAAAAAAPTRGGPSTDAKPFAGLAFLVTSGGKAGDAEQSKESKIALEDTIKALGGSIVENIPPPPPHPQHIAAQSPPRRQSLGLRRASGAFTAFHIDAVLAGALSRTPKFVFAAIKGIPVVSLEWVHACKRASKRVSWDKYVLHRHREAATRALFFGMKVHYAAKDKTTKAKFTDILRHAGAEMVKELREGVECHLVIHDSEDEGMQKAALQSLRRLARHLRVTVRDRDWALRALMAGEMPTNEHVVNQRKGAARSMPHKRRCESDDCQAQAEQHEEGQQQQQHDAELDIQHAACTGMGMDEEAAQTPRKTPAKAATNAANRRRRCSSAQNRDVVPASAAAPKTQRTQSPEEQRPWLEREIAAMQEARPSSSHAIVWVGPAVRPPKGFLDSTIRTYYDAFDLGGKRISVGSFVKMELRPSDKDPQDLDYSAQREGLVVGQVLALWEEACPDGATRPYGRFRRYYWPEGTFHWLHAVTFPNSIFQSDRIMDDVPLGNVKRPCHVEFGVSRRATREDLMAMWGEDRPVDNYVCNFHFVKDAAWLGPLMNYTPAP